MNERLISSLRVRKPGIILLACFHLFLQTCVYYHKVPVFMFSINSDIPVKQWDEKPNISTSWNGSNDNTVLESLLSKKSQGRIFL